MAAVAEKTKLKPLGARVVIKALDRDEVTKSGIIIPDTAKEKPQEGKILAVGPGDLDDDGKRIPLDVKVGDRVLYQKYAGTEFKLEDEELLILAEKDVLALIVEGQEMAKQLVFTDEARKKLKQRVHVMANAVKTTLGPKGRNVSLAKKFGSP